MFGSEQVFPKPAKAVVPQKETSLYGNEVVRPTWKRQFEAQGMKSKVFEQMYDVVPIRLRDTAAQTSIAFDFVFNPEVSGPGELQRPKQNVIYDDDRYSVIKDGNRNFSEAEKREQEAMKQKRLDRWKHRQEVLQKAYDELR